MVAGKNKIYVSIFSLALLAASCSAPVPAGVVKSVNGGADWQFANAMQQGQAGNLGILNISKLAFDSHNREIVYAGGYNGGLYKSTDSGTSWVKILSKILVYEFVVHPQDPKTIYVAGAFGGFGKVLKTVDGGSTWQEIYNEPTAENPVRTIAVNPNNPNEIVIGTTTGSIIKSSDSGLSWQLAADFQSRVNRMAWQNNALYVLFQTKGLQKSTDSAATFQSLTDSLNLTLSVGNYTYNTGSGQFFNEFYVDSLTNSLIYLTTTRGLYKTSDEGKTWQFIKLPGNGGESNARAIAIARSSSNIVYTSVGGTIYKSLDGGVTWQTQAIVTVGFINYILVDPVLPQIVYGGIYGQ